MVRSTVMNENNTSETSFMRPVKQGLVLIILTLILGGVFLGLYSARRIFLIFLVGVGLGAVIAPAFPYLKHKLRIPFGLTALLMLLIFLILFLSSLIGLSDLVTGQILPVLSELPSLIQFGIERVEDNIKGFPSLRNAIHKFSFDFEKYGPQIYQSVVNAIRASGSALIYMVFIVAVAIYTATDTHRYKKGLISLLPGSIRKRTLYLLIEVGDVLRSWLLSQLIVMVGVGAMTAVALLIIGMPQWISYSVLAGVLNLIPYVGPFVTAGILALVSLATQPDKTIWIVLSFTVIQQIESYLLVPWAMGRIRIPPIYLLAFIFVMGNWFGLLGIFVASPILAVARKLIILTYIEPRKEKLAHS